MDRLETLCISNSTLAMNLVTKVAAAVIVGAAIGLAATWFTVVRGAIPGGLSNGPWRTNLAAGDSRSDPYTRARVAVHGLFALNHSETIYFTAAQDSDGAPLNGRCIYQVSGRDPDARWWSITAYGPDDYLIPNAAGSYSVSKTTVARSPDGTFTIRVGGAGSASNWIPLAPERFSLTLRLYNPGELAAIDPVHAALPAIKKIACP
jgi:hypothetical protein